MNQLQQLDTLALEGDFYTKPFKFSYSSINKLLFSPSLFYAHYVLNQKEDKTDSYLVEGKLIHCLYLEPEKFNAQFVLQPAIPSENTKNVIDRVWQMYKSNALVVDMDITLNELQEEILSVLVEMNLHQSLKTDAQRLEKILGPASTDPYFAFIKTKESKNIVDSATYEKCKDIVDKLKINRFVDRVMKPVSENGYVVFNEVYLQIDKYLDKPYGLKGIIDNITIDLENKKIFVNDIKTTGKALSDFSESVYFYNYWIQCTIYYALLRQFEDIAGYISQGFTLQFNFIVIDKYSQIYPVPVSDITLQNWNGKFELDILPQVDYHYINREFDLPYKFALGLVEL